LVASIKLLFILLYFSRVWILAATPFFCCNIINPCALLCSNSATLPLLAANSTRAEIHPGIDSYLLLLVKITQFLKFEWIEDWSRAQVFVGDEHAPGSQALSLPFLLCKTETMQNLSGVETLL